MKKLFASMIVCSLAILATLSLGHAGDKTAPKIEGKWNGMGAISEGKKLPDDFITKAMLVVTFKDGNYTVTLMGKDLEGGTYKVDGSTKPAGIDLNIATGPDKGKTQLGIFQVEGDKLTIALANAGKERPKDFAGAATVEVTFLTRGK